VVKSVGLFVLSGSSVRTRIGGRPRWVGQSKAMGHDQFVMQLHTNCRHIVFDCGLSRTFLRSRPSGRLHHRCISWRPDGSRVRRLVKLAQKHVCWPRDSSRRPPDDTHRPSLSHAAPLSGSDENVRRPGLRRTGLCQSQGRLPPAYPAGGVAIFAKEGRVYK
jgi:hypothetical protein